MFFIGLLVFILAAGFFPGLSEATEEYAIETGRGCAHCHLSASGGGELTEAGRGYLVALEKSTPSGPSSSSFLKSSPGRLLRLLVGYIHILTGFFWFGTILYVHLVLKPSYASTGLPRGEVRLGLVSMGIMAVTGIILTVHRVPNLDFFFATRFGMLLLVKIGLFGMMVCSALFVVLVLGPRLKRKSEGTAASGEEITPEILAGLDGKEGRQAAFAYQGVVYDVTDSRLWKGGSHLRRHQAGFDLTDQLPLAPHGLEKIEKMPVMGKLVSGEPPPGGLQPRHLFYAMAYLNLGFVLAIILVLSLWKWW